MSLPVSLAKQASRLLRRVLTGEEESLMAKAESQGYNVAGTHYGDFTKDLPSRFPNTGEKSSFHMDLTPSRNQSLAREINTYHDSSPNSTTEVVLAKLRNPVAMSDERVNNLLRDQKKKLQSKETTGAMYPNELELSGGNPANMETFWQGPMENFASQHAKATLGNKNPNSMVFNPSAAIFDPADVRRFGAAFDPKKNGKVGYMLGAGAAAPLGSSVMDNYQPAPVPQRPMEPGLENISLDDMPIEAIKHLLGIK